MVNRGGFLMDGSFSVIPQTYEDLLHEIFDHSSEGFQVIDADWRYIYVNQEVAKQGKSRPESLLGHSIIDEYPGIEKTDLFKHMKRVMEEKVSISMENEFLFPDGTKGWFQLFIHPFSGGIYIFSVDISDRKEQENAVMQKIDMLSKVFASAESDKTLFTDLQNAMHKLYRSAPVER